MTWLTTKFESLKIWSSRIFSLLAADRSPAMPLYSASLFVAGKYSLRHYLNSSLNPSHPPPNIAFVADISSLKQCLRSSHQQPKHYFRSSHQQPLSRSTMHSHAITSPYSTALVA
ncbi:hypothetical protein Acr_00g0051710 [Actinidia rufa]|uniref:Uncharacterized protein n=1 Tax=Actinidia rufa TaxID=165716 RepID=A0A7J0DKV3_9ERIC|nr:hypothetical protein Acr_00g0051710 [Actinidia rufa]